MIPDWAKELYRAARIRAAKRRVPFTLTKQEMADLVAHANGRCVICGIPFEFDKRGHRVKRPFAPSLDRIDHERGYVTGNVRIVAVIVNVAMNVWGEAALRRVAEGICGYTNMPGLWAPPINGAGVTVRRRDDGRCRYTSRIIIDGKQYSFGSYPSRAEAAKRTEEVRQALKDGIDLLSLLSKSSLSARRRSAQALPNEKLLRDLKTLINH